jgi:hypothetical protein
MATKLSDMQRMLLSTASQRDDGHLLPLPETLKGKERPSKPALAALLKKELVSETQTENAAQQWRKDGDQGIGLVITASGLATIGVADGPADKIDPVASSQANAKPDPVRAGTKSARVVELLSRKDGATISDLVEATGWLPHTVRAALTGLKKKGHAIVREAKDGASFYRTDAGAAR